MSALGHQPTLSVSPGERPLSGACRPHRASSEEVTVFERPLTAISKHKDPAIAGSLCLHQEHVTAFSLRRLEHAAWAGRTRTSQEYCCPVVGRRSGPRKVRRGQVGNP